MMKLATLPANVSERLSEEIGEGLPLTPDDPLYQADLRLAESFPVWTVRVPTPAELGYGESPVQFFDTGRWQHLIVHDEVTTFVAESAIVDGRHEIVSVSHPPAAPAFDKAIAILKAECGGENADWYACILDIASHDLVAVWRCQNPPLYFHDIENVDGLETRQLTVSDEWARVHVVMQPECFSHLEKQATYGARDFVSRLSREPMPADSELEWAQVSESH